MTENVNRNIPPELSDADAELLSAYLDDMLTPTERDVLEARLAVDAFLRAERAAMRRTVDWLNQMPALKAPRNFTISAESVAQDPPPNVVLMPRRNLWLSAAAAVIVVALFGVAFIAGNMMNGEQAPSAEVLRTSDETVVQGADGSAQIAFASTNMPIGTSTPQQETFSIAATAGFIGTPLAPQTMSLPTATQPIADIAMAAAVADTVEEENQSDNFDAAGSTIIDEQAESSLSQADSAVATVVVEATSQQLNARMMTFTPMPSPTAAPTQAATQEVAPMVAGGAPAEVSDVEMTATSLALLSQSAPADMTTQNQATGAANNIDGIALKQEDIRLSVRLVVFYILRRYIEFVRTAP